MEPFHLKDAGLGKRHRLKHKLGWNTQISRGDVVFKKDEDRNHNKWKFGVVEEEMTGRDGIVRAAKLRAGKTILGRAVQQLYPLELPCDRERVVTQAQLN